MSSLLTLRSGNRGRCSQLCRKEYTLLKDGSPLSKEGFLLSMKDLNTSLSLGQLLDLGIDSLKIEGRMKNSDYVKRVTESYRGIIDHYPQKFEVNLESIFHRSYTKGFLFNEDKGKIVNTIKQNNLGEAIGFVDKYKDNQIYVKLMKPLHLKDRIRIDDKEETYFSIDVMYDAAKTSISEAKNFCVLNVRTQITPGSKIYRTIDSQLDLTLDDTYKLPITIYAKGRLNEPLSLVAYDGNNYFDEQSDECFQKALKAPLTKEAIFNQINKLKDTPLKIDEFTLDLEGELFMSVKGINEVRRKLIDKIIESHQFSRENKEPITLEPFFFQKENSQLAVYAESKEQYDVAKEMGVKTIYYENVSPYVGSHYPKVEGPILIGSYGGIAHYSGQEQILDSSFNISNEEACYHLYKDGASRVTLSQELSISEISALYNNYVKKFGGSPNLEIIAYGQMKLMTTKYCPLASLKQCGQCHEHHYSLKDEYTEFPLKSTNCMMGLYNLKPLNLIDELYEINKYANVIRLNFTFENKDETRKVIAMFQEKMENYERTNLFQKDKETHGYYKRPIL